MGPVAAVCCGCVQPASTKPRKTYNILVPALFAGQPIKPDEPLDSSVRRKIQKLQEYVQMSPAKIPKVSRRLLRRIKRAVRQPGPDHLGHIKVAVHAYCYLLAKSLDETASYSASYYATELVTGPDALIPSLLKDGRIELRTLGAELLAVFIHAQPEVDNQLDNIQDLVPQVCKAAKGALHADKAELKAQDVQKRQQAGDKMAMAGPMNLIARKDPVKVAALETACLRALTELLQLCARGRALPRHLDAIEGVVLQYLEVHGQMAPSDDSAAKEASPSGIVDHAAYEAMGVAKQVPTGTVATELAARLLQLVADFTKDIASAPKVMDAYYQYMDTHHAWHNAAIRKAMAQVLQNSGSEHQFPIFTSMLRHAGAPSLSLLDCVVLLELATKQGLGLPQGWALSALAVALQELPRAWEEQLQHTKQTGLQAVLDVFRSREAKAVAAMRTASLTSAGGQALPHSPLADASTLAAASSTPGPAAAVSGAAAAAGAMATGGSGSGHTTQQQLALLHEAMLATVAALASRVGSVAELAEAAVIGLQAAASSSSVPTGTAGASEPSVAMAMALACLAEAAEAVAKAGAAAHEGDARVLPGRVLPPALVALLLPVLKSSWPQEMRRDACRILLALVPCAPQGFATADQALAVATFIGNELTRSAAAGAPAPDAPTSSSGSTADERGPVAYAALDALARCALRGPPKPAVQLKLGRTCLKLARKWGQHSYRGSGGSAVQVVATMLVYNGILEALAATTGAAQLQQHRLPLPAGALPALQRPSGTLTAAAPAFSTADAAAAEAAVSALEAAGPTASQAAGVEAALLQAPSLVQELGEQLPTLLRATSAAATEAAPEQAAPAPERFQDKVNTLLVQRMNTLRKDLTHVSELLRGGSTSPRGTAATPAAAASTATQPSVITVPEAAAAAAAAAAPAAGSMVNTKGAQLSLHEVLALSNVAPGGSAYAVGDVQLARLAGQLEPLVR